MLIAVTVDNENKLSSSIENTEQILIFNRKFDRIKLVESKIKLSECYHDLIEVIKGCKYIVSSYIDCGSEISRPLTDLGIKIVKEERTKDPCYAIRLISN